MKGKYYGLVLIMVIVIVGSIVGFEYSETWQDTGKVNWVGQKFFVNGCESLWSSTCIVDHLYYATPYSILTLTHGTLNFTWHGSHGLQGVCGNAEINQFAILTLGTPVGVVRYNCGGVDVVFDP